MRFLSINETAKVVGLPHTCLRSRLTDGKLPGFYNGAKFMVNVDMLISMLEDECLESVGELSDAKSKS